jgi:hypothetical protein
MLQHSFKVRDFRDKGFFMLDDAYLNGYAKHLDPITTVVYLSLCRHADKKQVSFPSQELIAKEHNINPRTVRRKIKALLDLNIIQVKQKRSTRGKFLHNTYILLDKAEWKNPVGHGSPTDNRRTRESYTVGHGSPHKETHNKETHITLYSKTENLSSKDFQEIADKYNVPISFVLSKYDDMVLWAGERTNNPKTKGRNWKLTLMKWVKTDAIKIKERGNQYVRPAIDARNSK